jgi:hypothetical protein
MTSGTIEITKERYEELLKAEDFLNCLRLCGVDNWDYYDDAVQMMEDGE